MYEAFTVAEWQEWCREYKNVPVPLDPNCGLVPLLETWLKAFKHDIAAWEHPYPE